MTYIIAGTVTFASQANRDAAVTRVNTAVSGFSFANVATTFTPGINTPTTTTITFSVQVNGTDEDARQAISAIYGALTSANRHTSGWVSVNEI